MRHPKTLPSLYLGQQLVVFGRYDKTGPSTLQVSARIGGASKTYGPFAASISFGLIFAMAGTLFAVPLAYTALIEIREDGVRLLRRMRGQEEAAAGEGGYSSI